MSRLANERRGTSLVEVLIATAVLSVGLTAVVSLLVQGASTSKGGIRQFEATSYGMSRLNELAMKPVGAIPFGTFDAGAYVQSGVVVYSSTATVENLATLAATASATDGGVSGSAAGASWPGHRITVRVTWVDALRRTRTQAYTTIVSEAFDGGL
jgi:prepilin-type N-terminal cleavage/methylation domain-containing protein